ncbi:MAG TPA: hypothetical protein VGN69_02665 [Solirubrobacteraceae bacterium]|nr:hypothetical protein [Solirubrobacteraceae bacterium]
MTGREASIFACLVDAAVAPGPPLPAVADTDAVPFFAGYLKRCPLPNHWALRGALLALELGPRVLGYGGRLRQLSAPRRVAYLTQLERGATQPLAKALLGVAQLAYYGDAQVMALLGYDAQARVDRGRELRRAERRW